MYVSMSYTGLHRRDTLFVFVWLRHRNTWIRIQQVGLTRGVETARASTGGRVGRSAVADSGMADCDTEGTVVRHAEESGASAGASLPPAPRPMCQTGPLAVPR